jgi:hypothetical protein
MIYGVLFIHASLSFVFIVLCSVLAEFALHFINHIEHFEPYHFCHLIIRLIIFWLDCISIYIHLAIYPYRSTISHIS